MAADGVVKRVVGQDGLGEVALASVAERLDPELKRAVADRELRDKVMRPFAEAMQKYADTEAPRTYFKNVMDSPNWVIPGVGFPTVGTGFSVLVLPFDYMSQDIGAGGGTANITPSQGQIDVFGFDRQTDGGLSARGGIGVGFEATTSGSLQVRPVITVNWNYNLISYIFDCHARGKLMANVLEVGGGVVAQSPVLGLFDAGASGTYWSIDEKSDDGGGPIGNALAMTVNVHAGRIYQFWLTAELSGDQSGDNHAFGNSFAQGSVSARLIMVACQQ